MLGRETVCGDSSGTSMLLAEDELFGVLRLGKRWYCLYSRGCNAFWERGTRRENESTLPQTGEN
jgi:hypothetical protein